MTTAEPKQKSEQDIRTELAAELIARRTGKPSPRAQATRRRKLMDAPPPPRSVNDPLYAAEVTALAGSAAYLAHMPWYGGVPIGICAALGAGTAAHQTWGHRGTTAYALTCGLAAGAAVAYQSVHPVWTAPGAVAMAATMTALGPVYGTIRRRHDKRYAKEVAEAKSRREELQRSVWEKIIAQAGAKDVRILREWNDETWTNGRREYPAGFALAIELGPEAPEGKSLASMTPKMEQLAWHYAKLHLRSGTIQVRSLGYATQWEVVIPNGDVLRETIPFRLESGWRSINDTIYVAMAADGTAVGPNFMQTPHGMWAGMTDQGKTTFLNAHLCETTRCNDNVTWLISGGKAERLFKPWMQAFLKGTPSSLTETGYVEPVLDWIAGDIREATMMLADAYKAICARAASVADKEGDDEEKWIPHKDGPRITIFIDEPRNFLNSTFKIKPWNWSGKTDEQDEEDGTQSGWTFSDYVIAILTEGRSEGVSLVLMVQRGTNDLLGDQGGTMKSQIRYRVSFRQQGALEQGKTFSSDTYGIDVTTLSKGEIFAEIGDEVARPLRAKGYYPSWDTVRAASVAHTAYAYPLDPETADELDFYAGRWTRESQQEMLRRLIREPVRTIPGRAAGRTMTDVGEEGEQIPDLPPELEAREAFEMGAAAEGADEVSMLEAMYAAPSHDRDSNDEAPGAEPEETPWGARFDSTLRLDARQLLDVIASSNLLYGKWVISHDLVALAAQHLDWPADSTSGAKRVKAALAAAGVEQPSKPPKIDGKDSPRGYWSKHIAEAISKFMRPEHRGEGDGATG